MPGRSSRRIEHPPRPGGGALRLLLVLAICAPAHALDDLAADLPKSWRVGLTSWGGEKLAPSQEYLRFSLPLALRDRLSGIRSRELDSDERTALARLLARKRADALAARLRDANRARDELVFKGLPEAEAEKALADLEAKRRDLAATMALFTDRLPHLAVVPSEIPLVFEPTNLLPPPGLSVEESARRTGADILVWGRLEPVQGYLYWKVAAYSAPLRREIFAAERVSASEAIEGDIEEAVAGMAEALLGRPWAALTVVPEPERASVRVDGHAAGVGTVELRYLAPGPHHVGVVLEGYETHEETVFLEPSRTSRSEVALAALPTRTITLESAPAGARVYRDSLYVGSTPLDLAIPSTAELTYRLDLKDYFEQYQTVDAGGPAVVQAELRRRLVDTTKWQELKRKRFYRSLGAFALSVPIGIVSYAVALDAAVARTNTFVGSDEYNVLTRRATIGYALYLGGLFTSVVLGINMVADLQEYVRYADDPHLGDMDVATRRSQGWRERRAGDMDVATRRSQGWRRAAPYRSREAPGGSVFERKPRGLAERLATLFGLGRRDEPLFEELEDALIEADFGAQAAVEAVDRLRKDGAAEPKGLRQRLKELLLEELRAVSPRPEGPPPGLLMVLGVNGVGKTTTVAKLAAWYRRESGLEALLCAADTFRAAAIDQLKLLGERLALRVASQQHGADPGAVIYDAVTSARSHSTPLVIVDTAGRMHSRTDLVRELEKIDRVVRSRIGDGWYHKALVIDATTGQNALQQAEVFHKAIGIDSVIVAKADSTARGGIVVAISRTLGLPFSFLGVGERLEDLVAFEPGSYLDSLLGSP